LNSPPLPLKNVPEIVMVNDINETIRRVQPTLDKVDKVVAHVESITANLASKESLQSVNESLKKVRDILVKTDDQVYGNDGVLPLVRTILKDVIVKLQKVNAALDNVVKISADTAESTKDLKVLRTEIDTTVNTIGNMVKEIDKKIPFKKEPEVIRLP
jgi:phospholipid/cholesterol/gamma-HCH transport system substrate-binding protein